MIVELGVISYLVGLHVKYTIFLYYFYYYRAMPGQVG